MRSEVRRYLPGGICPACRGDGGDLDPREAHPLRDEVGGLQGGVFVFQDITGAQAGRRGDQTPERSALPPPGAARALREIDMAITASLDLRLTLNVCLTQVLLQLQVDAAEVLLYDPQPRSWITPRVRASARTTCGQARLRSDYCGVGRVVRDRCPLYISDLGQSSETFSRAPFRRRGSWPTTPSRLSPRARSRGCWRSSTARVVEPDVGVARFPGDPGRAGRHRRRQRLAVRGPAARQHRARLPPTTRRSRAGRAPSTCATARPKGTAGASPR